MAINCKLLGMLIFGLPLVVTTSGCQSPAELGAAPVQVASVAIDSIAEKILLYQRDNGGWAQSFGNTRGYLQPISADLRQKITAEKDRRDTNIDDQATTTEINYLVKAYTQTHNEHYLAAAERGIRYLLAAQNRAGGWPQYFPDTSKYRRHITYNDNAMINVMWVLDYTARGHQDYLPLQGKLGPAAAAAVAKGIACILRTQYRQGGVLTAWCAQHDNQTLLPASARAFELASLSGSESTGILRFLMALEQPSSHVKTAIQAGIAWLERVKIPGYRLEEIQAPQEASGRDRVLVADPTAVLWARFYHLETNQPFFTGRDGQPKATLAEIENERRIGYGYYGTWPEKLIQKEYPKWLTKWGQ